ncbi:MAG: ATP-binding protein [Crocinitomicaceae bacterium]|nr:ATP-binding protein [Crocinitomicaceae bacterium]
MNFQRATELKGLFLPDLNIKRLITAFEIYSGIKIQPENTLIILDEIQMASKGITSLKYFHEDAPEYSIVAAGSLLGLNLHPDESFPVGKVSFMELQPLSFYEFLLALGEDGLAQLLKEKLWELLPSFSEKFKEHLRYYFYIGGMPEVVAHFAHSRDWKKVRSIQNELLQTYKNDFSKHAPTEIIPRIHQVWESIPAQLAKENKKFIYGIIREGARAKDFELAIQWLVDYGLLHKINAVSKPALPLKAYQQATIFKLYHNDLGLLGAMAELSVQTILHSDAIFTEFKGALTEQFVFQELKLDTSRSIFYFPFKNSQNEIDFILQNEVNSVIPIEVKAGENLRAKSFKLFCEKYQPKMAIRTSLSGYREELWMTNVPLYIVRSFLSS